MSLLNIDEMSKSEDFFSVKSDISDNSESFKSLISQSNGNVSTDVIQQIGHLQDKRYDATYNISQLKRRIVIIEKQELELMKESTIQHSRLQDYYVICRDDDNHVKSLAQDAAKRLGSMKYELKTLNDQVQMEQQKLEVLEDHLQTLTRQMDENMGHEREDINRQRLLIEDQRDQQWKHFEDLEFRELETQSRFEEESEMLKRNIIEAQRKSIVSSRDRENKKLVLDEQQINLMKDTRRALDQLESERNYYNQQVVYYQQIVNSCNVKIEELNQRLNVSNYESFVTDQNIHLAEHNGTKLFGNNGYPYISEFTDVAETGVILPQVGQSAAYMSGVNGRNSDNLRDKLESLTELVRMNLNSTASVTATNCDFDEHCRISLDDPNMTPRDLYRRPITAASYPSTISLSDDSFSNAATDSAICLSRKHVVTFESMSIIDCSSSNRSSNAGHETLCSVSDLNSDMSQNDENCRPGSKPLVVARKKDKPRSRSNKQSRPLTCFLPKMHSDFNLRQHIESCGHDMAVCANHIILDKISCQGFLWKLSNRLFAVYRKRWFYFDQTERELRYYTSKSMTKLKGIVRFQSISDVFVDHTHRARSPQKLSFCIETPAKTLYLITAKPELVTLWVDVIFTGAEAYMSLHPSVMTNSMLSQCVE